MPNTDSKTPTLAEVLGDQYLLYALELGDQYLMPYTEGIKYHTPKNLPL